MLIKSSWTNSCATRSIGEWKYTVTRSSSNGLHSLTCIVIPTLFDPWKGSFSLTNDMILSSLEVRNWKDSTFSGSRFNLKTLKVSLIEVWTQEACRLWSDTARWKITDVEACKWISFSWLLSKSAHPNTTKHERYLKFPVKLWIFAMWRRRLHEEKRFRLQWPQTKFRRCNVGSYCVFGEYADTKCVSTCKLFGNRHIESFCWGTLKLNSGFLKRFCTVSLYENSLPKLRLKLQYFDFVHFSMNRVSAFKTIKKFSRH